MMRTAKPARSRLLDPIHQNYAGVPMITLKLNGHDHQLDVTESMPLLRASLPVRYPLQGWQKAEI